ncbi:helix-turn-helix domain-containing protein [Bowmanella dokdonensis]|uniref:MerR family transcriptional regulator n=1 Tax=Bowmanella dokdonensis TaxID=751969 RepID=A0A939IPD4_9ALTE|nr:helix-turn-helix domain-containing protein [Bowmanella dokdonensis]MBN7825780.1 MerR family transcriptional regulator [Bowmanella dokdonensis]
MSYSLDQLATLADLPKRTIRYYMHKGLVSRPEGARKTATYTDQHLEQLMLVKKWKQAGLNLERIGELLQQDTPDMPIVSSQQMGEVSLVQRIFVSEGVVLELDPARASLSQAGLRSFINGLSQLLNQAQEHKDE